MPHEVKKHQGRGRGRGREGRGGSKQHISSTGSKSNNESNSSTNNNDNQDKKHIKRGTDERSPREGAVKKKFFTGTSGANMKQTKLELATKLDTNDKEGNTSKAVKQGKDRKAKEASRRLQDAIANDMQQEEREAMKAKQQLQEKEEHRKRKKQEREEKMKARLAQIEDAARKDTTKQDPKSKDRLQEDMEETEEGSLQQAQLHPQSASKGEKEWYEQDRLIKDDTDDDSANSQQGTNYINLDDDEDDSDGLEYDDPSVGKGQAIDTDISYEDGSEDDLFDEIGGTKNIQLLAGPAPASREDDDKDDEVASKYMQEAIHPNEEENHSKLVASDAEEEVEMQNDAQEETEHIPNTNENNDKINTVIAAQQEDGIDEQSVTSTPNEEEQQHHSETVIPATNQSVPSNFKKVNAQSRNRRTCVRATTGQGERTPEKSNKTTHVHRYQTRVTWKMSIPASNEPIKKVKEVAQEFLRELAQIDSKIALLPWNDHSSSPPITSKSKMPDTVTGTHKFLHKLFAPKIGMDTTVYPQVRLGHDKDFQTLREEIHSWVSSYNHGMFYNMLQEEDGTDIGWLLYSTREMDEGALADEIIDTIGVNIGLRWKTIPTGARKIASNNMVRALVVEVSARQKWDCQSALLLLYSRKMKDISQYPNGIRLRFVKLKKSGVNQVEKSKMEKLRQRQKEFLQTVTSTTNHDIFQLDYSKNTGKIPTLRQMIMSLTSRSYSPLFHAVDMDWRADGFVFQFSSTLAEEAETAMMTLLPLLEHHFPDCDVRDNFTQEAKDRSKTMVWDEKRRMIIDTAAGHETEEIEEDENLVGFEFSAEAAESLERPVVKTFAPHDDDSISTLRSADGTTKGIGSSRLPAVSIQTPATSNSNDNQHSNDANDDQQSIATASTSLTMESFNILDSRITGLSSQLIAETRRNKAQFEEIMRALSSLTHTSKNDQPSSTSTLNAGDDKHASGRGS